MTRLKRYMQERKVQVRDLAACLSLPRETASRKANGKLAWKLAEAAKIREAFFSDVALEDLFRESFETDEKSKVR